MQREFESPQEALQKFAKAKVIFKYCIHHSCQKHLETDKLLIKKIGKYTQHKLLTKPINYFA